MSVRRIRINLNYVSPESSFIYPIHSESGDQILDARMMISAKLLADIRRRFGDYVYYTDTGERAIIPAHHMRAAYNKSRELVEEIGKTQKISRIAFRETERVVEEIVNDLSAREIEAIDLMKDLKSADEYHFTHSVNVGVLAGMFAKKRGIYSRDEIKYITLGSYLHDVGCTRLDQQLLKKPGKLTVTEIQKMKRHPQLGYELLKSLEHISPIVLQCVLFHHERFNHEGYYGLPYETLPEFPKMVSICDIYDALTSKRPYRSEVAPAFALKAVVNAIESHFDYELISEFVNKISPILNHTQMFYTMNDICELSTQELALIKGYGRDDFMKPRVNAFCKFERKGSQLHVSYYTDPVPIDLSSDPARKLTKILNNERQVQAIREKIEERGLD